MTKYHKVQIQMMTGTHAALPREDLQITTQTPVSSADEFKELEEELKLSVGKRRTMVKIT